MTDAPVLEVRDLRVEYRDRRRRFAAVDGVSFSIDAGRTLGLVGESGSGKTTIGKAVLGLAPIAGGTVHFQGRSVGRAGSRERRRLGAARQVVFQDPYSSLDPTKSIGYSLEEPAVLHGASRAAARERAIELLSRVGLDAAALGRYPTQFSGGQRQRIAIARALMTEPAFLVCDEPVSALDLSVQADVMNLLTRLQQEFGLTLLFISHDLAVVRQISDDVIVLRAGAIVEGGPTEELYRAPRDAYTRRLLEAAPRTDRFAPASAAASGAPTGAAPSPAVPEERIR